MRAESRIALVLVVCLLGGLGFFVQQRLKSDTNEITDESLAQFLAADQSDSGSSNTDTSETQTVNTHPAQASSAQTPPAQNDEPPRDLFTSDEFATPRETTRTANTGSSAVSPNPWSQTPAQPTTPSDSRTGVATAGPLGSISQRAATTVFLRQSGMEWSRCDSGLRHRTGVSSIESVRDPISR